MPPTRRSPAAMAARSSSHFVSPMLEVYKTTQSPFAREVIERLQAVYIIEAEIRGSSAEQRLAARRIRTAPLMEALKARLTSAVGQLFSQSTLTGAINYTLNHWDGLTLFLGDGRVEVDSNTVERSMRPIAMAPEFTVQRQRRRRRELGDPGIARQHGKAP